ncbi:hypothetical protein HDU89_000948, partial [Geranomyces variabilis]
MALFRTGYGRKSLLGTFVREMENITPVVNSRLLSSGFKLDFMRKPTLPPRAVQAKRTGPTTSEQSGTGTTRQAVSSKTKLNALSMVVGSATELKAKAKGKHWKKNQKRNAKKKEEKRKRKPEASSASSFT